MTGMHALHKILADKARPERPAVTPGEFLEIEPDVYSAVVGVNAGEAQPGDIIVAGQNFGCGSSTPAHQSILALGIPAVIAESYGKLFLSNCVSGGLWLISCSGIVGLVNTGDRIEIDTDQWQVRNPATGKTLQCAPLPVFYREMIELGGEKPYLKARIACVGIRYRTQRCLS